MDPQPLSSKASTARTAEYTPSPDMPLSRRASIRDVADDSAPKRPEGGGMAPQRRNTLQPKAGWAGTKDSMYDRLGERVPEKTFKGLANLVATQSAFKESRLARNIAFGMQKTGLMSYKSAARMLRVPPHVAQVIWLAISDPEVRKIAKMGLEVSRANPETNGIPPEGFKPLYDLMAKWGVDRKGHVVDPAKFAARKQFMAERQAEVDHLRQFGNEIAPHLPGASEITPETEAQKAEDNSIVSFLASFFVASPESRPAAKAG